MSILKTLRKWVTGKSDEDDKKKKRDALRVTNYGGGAARNDTKGEVKRSIQKAEKAKEQKAQSSSAFKATPPSVKKAEAKDKQTSQSKPKYSSAFKATSFTPKHQSTALGTVSEKEVKARTAKKNAFEANRKEQSRAADKLKPLIDKKYDASTKEGRRRIKMGEYQSDPNVAKYETLKHPMRISATRGALSGATFGLSELAAAKLPKSKEMEEAERLYQANKSKGAEFAGEMVGSLTGFGLTSDLSKAAISKAAPKLTAKLGERTTERLATNKLVMNAARKEAARKLGAAATEEGVKRFAKARAAKLVAALGEDAAINLTTGAVSDVSHAIIDSDSPAEFVKNLGISAGTNILLGGAATAIPAFKGNAVEDAVGNVAQRVVRNEADDVLERATKEADDALKRATVEPEINTPKPERLNIEDEIRVNEPKAEPKKTRTVDDIRAEMDDAHRVAGDVNASAEERQAATEKFSELNEELAAKEAREVDEQVKEAVNNEYVERERNAKKVSEKYRDYDKEIREATNGEFGERKGVVSVGKGSNPKEQKRVLAKMGREVDSIINDSGAIENADAFETAYRTWNAPRKANTMQKSYAKASESVNDIADSIKAKVESFTKNPDNGTGMKIEDVFDMIAVKQVYKDSGMEMPEDLQEAFTKLILANKTEHAQGLSVIEQVLREFDPDYRKAFIRKDFEKFLSRFGNVESWDEVAASLDRNHKTEGYLQDKLQELVDFKVDESGTADEYKKLYKDLQNEILRNSKPNLWNMLDSLRHTFMLSNFATAARNIYGNASQRIMYDISDALTAQFEASLERRIARNPEVAKKYGEGFERTTTALIKSKDNRAFASLGRIREGKLGEGLSRITDDAAKAADSEYIKTLEKNLKEDVQDVMGYEKLMPHLEKGMDYAPKNAREKLATKAYRLSQKGGKVVSFMLNEPDSWFVERNYRTALAKYLEANGITNMASLKGKEEVLKRAREHAKEVALENTYKKANRLTTFIERARAAGKKQGANPLQMAGSIALDAELPYVKVPVNMFINNVKYSPVGIATNGWKAIKAAHIGDVQGLQKSVAELSKGVTGTGLAALGFMLACDENEQMDNDSIGIIAKANEALKEYGVRDNSIKVGEYNFNIADIGLGATQFLMGAAYAEALNENGGAPKGLLGDANAVLDAFRSTFDVVGDLSLMDNFMQTIDAFSTGYGDDVKLSDRVENASMQILPNYVNQYVPNPLRAVAKGTTKADLDTGTKKGKDVSKLERTLKRNINNQIQGIPVINEKGVKGTKFEGLPHKVDSHGRLVSTGLFPEGRDTKKKKAIQSAVNYADPLSTRKIKIPEADKKELKVKDKNGNPFKPKGFDPDREYKATVGEGEKYKETIELTGKEREKVALSAQKAGYDMADALVRKGIFGDRLGDRAQKILKDIPENEEKARDYLFSTPEWKNASNEDKHKFLEVMYGQGKNGMNNRGVSRTRKEKAYVDIAGNSEGDFRYQNDLKWQYHKKYEDYHFAEKGIDKGTWADVVQSVYDANHKWDDENKKNVDNPNSAKKVKLGILAVEGLTKAQRIAAYQAFRGKRTGFGWTDWDGESIGGGYYRRGFRRWRRWGRRSGSGGSSAKMDTSAFKATKMPSTKTKATKMPSSTSKVNSSPSRSSRSTTAPKSTSSVNAPKYKSLATALKTSGNTRGETFNPTSSVKYDTASAVKKAQKKKKTAVKKAPPKVKFKKYEV